MKVTTLWLALLPAVLSAQEKTKDPYDYDSGENLITNYWTFNVQISSAGFLLGGARNLKIAPYTHASVAADLFWVRGKDEQVDYLGRTINAESILMIPLTFTLKRRFLGEQLTNTFRPFVSIGAGGVYGWYIDGDLDRSELPADHDNTQVALTALAGLGADFGKPGPSAYGFDVKYQVLRFAHHLGRRRHFDNLQLGFHVNW